MLYLHGCAWVTGVYGWLALVMLMACGAPETPVEQPPQPGVALAERVAQWVLGERPRMVRKRARTAAQLLVLPQQGAPRALLGQCVNARSLLPSSVNPREVYVVVDGELHVIDTGAPQPALVPIAMEPAPLVLSHLLAMSRHAPPVVLLALAQQGTDDPQASAPALWQIVIEGYRARAAPILDDAQIADARTFFERFEVPRCREHASDCLVIANGDGQSYLDVDFYAGGNRREWRTLKATWVEDARWSQTEQSSALLLARCDQHAP